MRNNLLKNDRLEKNERQIRPGMEVIGEDGDHVGEVKEVRLDIRADAVDEQGWEMPELFATETTEESRRNR